MSIKIKNLTISSDLEIDPIHLKAIAYQVNHNFTFLVPKILKI